MTDQLLSILTIALSGLITIGGTIFNYYLTRRSKRLDDEQQRQADAEKLTARYAKPLLQAAWELEGRLKDFLLEDPHYRRALKPDWQPPAEWPVTHEYYLQSTIYTIGQFFAWIDIMRKEEIFLPLSNKEVNRKFQEHLNLCCKAFSNSRVAPGPSIYRPQQRAIGEQMSELSPKDETLRCIGYSTFVSNYQNNSEYRSWFAPIEALILSLELEGDPRIKRIEAITTQLHHFVHFINTQMGIQLIEERQSIKVPPELKEPARVKAI